MKTLDEVVKAMEYCKNHNYCDECPYRDKKNRYEDVCYEEDSLHYLKELRHILDNTVWVGSTKEENGYWKLPTLPETGNDPLTWDELKKMEGRPVWVEELGRKYATPHWAIHHGIMDGYDGDENLYLQPFEVLTKYTLGKTWQAYKKERKMNDRASV